jgi:hypothetical protein
LANFDRSPKVLSCAVMMKLPFVISYVFIYLNQVGEKSPTFSLISQQQSRQCS